MLFKIGFLLLIIPLLSRSQNAGDWKLYNNKKEIACSKGDSMQTIEVHKNDTSDLKFVFNVEDTTFVRSIVVMDMQRKGIGSKKLTANAYEAIFKIEELYYQSRGKDLTFYIVKIPADPAKAALVRVAPQPFCNLQWIE
jgi:hypothetical protein